ncbi:MAG: MgtC/SapB family protein [Clostridiales bacterium]|nr:MgtC/SapB family protein [Clostridiales bacterium]
MKLPEMLYEVNMASTATRLLLSLLCGGILGIERGRKKRPAGFRTYMLVCMGSTLVMITNQYMMTRYPSIDPARMGAQVISGIGFLGVGTIIVTGRNKVRGLTTAAGLWAAACVGLAIGIGFYSGALIGCVLTFFVMAMLHNLDDKVMSSTRVINLYVELSKFNLVGGFLKYVKENDLKVSDMEFSCENDISKEGIGLLLTIRSLKKRSHIDTLELLSKAEGVVYIEEL